MLAAAEAETDAPARIADCLEKEYGELNAVVHNAGVTRDQPITKDGRAALGSQNLMGAES